MTNFDTTFTHEAVYAAKAYGLGKLLSEEQILGGNTSRARRLDTEQGCYVLRKLAGADQARNEYNVAQILKGKKICPEILSTENGQGWIEMPDGFYNVQRWISPLSDQTPAFDYGELGEKVGFMHAALKDTVLLPQPDRFELEVIWTSFLSKYGQADHGYEKVIRRIALDVEACGALSGDPAHVMPIHGDLGTWNLVFGANGVRLIDFGELRIGNPLFDLAALLASSLDISDARTQNRLSEVIQGYCVHMRSFFEPEMLARQIRLWNVRGAVAILERNGLNEQTANYAERLMDQHEAFADWLGFPQKICSKCE